MNCFPNEVSIFIFNYLSPRDLVNCQLTNRNWNKSSLQLLYSKVIVNSYPKVLRYVKIISNSPERAKYLKSIDVGNMFSTYEAIRFWDNFNLVEALIKYCPNIIEIIATETCSQFWSRIYSATQKRAFAKLQVLPAPSVYTLDCYIPTALLCKKTLTSLSLTDRRSPDELTILDESITILESRAYQSFLPRLKDFCNLTQLHFDLYDNKQLDYFDSVIESCRLIRSLTFRLAVSSLPTKTTIPTVVLPRPHVHTLVCDWGFVNRDNQLEYIIQKFPNLQNLTISLGSFDINSSDNSVSYEAMTKFLQHTVTIPNFQLEFASKKHDVINMWIEFMKTTGFGTNIRIDFKYMERNSNNLVVHFDRNLTTFYFSPVQDLFYPSHINFISKIGREIQSINLKESTHERHFYQVLESCQSLKDMTFREPIDLEAPEFVNYQHNCLKSITLSIQGSDEPLDYLTQFSLNLPNLERLYLIDQKTFRLNNARHIHVKMTNSRFNMLSWSGESASGLVHEKIRCYIRVNTAIGERFYTGSKKGMFKITKQYYTQSSSKLYFDITCDKLDKFELTIRDTSRAEKEKTYTWNF